MKAIQILYTAVTKHWQAMSMQIAVIGATALYVINKFSPVKNSEEVIVGLLFFGFFAMVRSIIDLRQPPSPAFKKFSKLSDARRDILSVVSDKANARGRESVVIDIIGGRLKTIASICRDIAFEVERGTYGNTRLELNVCHLDENVMTRDDFPGYAKQHSGHLSIQRLEIESAFDGLDDVDVKFFPYLDLPHFFAIIIEEFCWFGPYTWDAGRHCYDNSQNRCYSCKADSEGIGGIVSYMKDRCDLLIASCHLRSAGHADALRGSSNQSLVLTGTTQSK